MSIPRAKLLLNELQTAVRQEGTNAGLGAKLFAIQIELNERLTQDQRSLYDQLLSVYQLANNNGHYDAADWILNNGVKPTQAKERSARIADRTKRILGENRG